eukprot:7074-Eustigmatos_ZCMA.PRE.1
MHRFVTLPCGIRMRWHTCVARYGPLTFVQAQRSPRRYPCGRMLCAWCHGDDDQLPFVYTKQHISPRDTMYGRMEHLSCQQKE